MQFRHECQVAVEGDGHAVLGDWADARLLPRFLSHIRATALDDGLEDMARFVITINHRHVEFTAERTLCCEDSVCWQSIGENFLYVLTVKLRQEKNARALSITVSYDPPGFVQDITEYLGRCKTFKQTLDEDMQRFRPLAPETA